MSDNMNIDENGLPQFSHIDENAVHFPEMQNWVMVAGVSDLHGKGITARVNSSLAIEDRGDIIQVKLQIAALKKPVELAESALIECEKLYKEDVDSWAKHEWGSFYVVHNTTQAEMDEIMEKEGLSCR